MKEPSAREQLHISLVKTIERMGYPAEFGEAIANALGTEKQISRMISWLIQYKPTMIEDIADEMLAIKSDFIKYRDKKIAEYYNEKHNRLLNSGPLDPDEEKPIGIYMLGEYANIIVDYPIGSFDGESKKAYTVNFGYVKDFFQNNGKNTRAYVMGIETPIQNLTGKVRAVVITEDEEKWVIIPDGCIMAPAEIAKKLESLESMQNVRLYMQ